ncbi:hypothetical protein [Symbiopectobacterium purcellii]|uniref:hypothetical protein n=1 Tax=Symbiopectobacterium purcellii TaxID=2871826 RepID=UPI003F876B14
MLRFDWEWGVCLPAVRGKNGVQQGAAGNGPGEANRERRGYSANALRWIMRGNSAWNSAM